MKINVHKLSKLLNKQHRFYLPEQESPTYYNLAKYLQQKGWNATRFSCLADLSTKNFQFDTKAAEQLEFKHLLAELVAESEPGLMPETYVINDDNWPKVLNHLAETHYKQDHACDNLIWILKPSKLNNGQYIKIIQNLFELEQHYISSKRLSGEHVLQRYIIHPDLLKGHKYSIRMFVVITNTNGVYLYPKGYLNVSLQAYQPKDFSQLNIHLTNEHLNDDEENIVQIPTERWDLFPSYYPQIKSIVAAVTQALHNKHPAAFTDSDYPCFALFGFDFMLDADKKMWLLEANHGPCFPVSEHHPLQKYLYIDFWQAFISEFVEPIVKVGSDNINKVFDRVI